MYRVLPFIPTIFLKEPLYPAVVFSRVVFNTPLHSTTPTGGSTQRSALLNFYSHKHKHNIYFNTNRALVCTVFYNPFFLITYSGLCWRK